MTIQKEGNSDFLRDYPFSLLDVEGPLEVWQRIYNPYIDLIESNIVKLNKNSIITVRNHNFAFNNAVQQRIADLIVSEEVEQKYPPVSMSSAYYQQKHKGKIEDQYSDVVEKENYYLKITFIFTIKKLHPLKFMQFLKITGEVKKYTELLHKKELKQYSKVIPQVIFISLFGFEPSIGKNLRDNLHGKIDRNIGIIVVPPIDNKIWNNFLVENSGDGNFNQAIIWADVLNTDNSLKLLDTTNSRKMIKELVIE